MSTNFRLSSTDGNPKSIRRQLSFYSFSGGKVKGEWQHPLFHKSSTPRDFELLKQQSAHSERKRQSTDRRGSSDDESSLDEPPSLSSEKETVSTFSTFLSTQLTITDHTLLKTRFCANCVFYEGKICCNKCFDLASDFHSSCTTSQCTAGHHVKKAPKGLHWCPTI